MTKLIENCLLFLWLATWSQAQDTRSDMAFKDYLTKIMEAYPAWLKENSFDPSSSPESNKLVIESLQTSPILLRCELTEQQMIGHSTSDNQTFELVSNFENHWFGVGRWLRQPYWLIGKFDCTGNLNTPETTSSSFRGNGSYMLNTNTSDEVAIFENVGVTSGHKLNLDLSWLSYELDLTFSKGLLSGLWNDSLSNEFEKEIEQEFHNTYGRYLKDPLKYGIKQLHPSLHLIENYLNNKTMNLDLTTIMDLDDLPIPYEPTEPTTIPTTAFTVPQTFPSSTSDVTETSAENSPSTSSTTEAETSTSLANKLVNTCFWISITAVLMIAALLC